MSNIASVTIHNVKIEFDVEKLNPEALKNMAVTAITRRLSLGAQTKSAENLTKLAEEMAIDPNPFFTSTRGAGVPRPKLSPIEKEAVRFFGDTFLPALKLALAGDTKAKSYLDLWIQAGGDGVLLKSAKEATAEQKAAVNKNLDAKAKIIAAKVRRLVKDNWQPPVASLKGLEL
jgi:hypothetical protein